MLDFRNCKIQEGQHRWKSNKGMGLIVKSENPGLRCKRSEGGMYQPIQLSSQLLTWRLLSPCLPHLHIHHASFLQQCVVKFTWTPYLTGFSHSVNYQLRQAKANNLFNWLNSAGRKQQADLEQAMGAAAQNLATKHNLQTEKNLGIFYSPKWKASHYGISRQSGNSC